MKIGQQASPKPSSQLKQNLRWLITLALMFGLGIITSRIGPNIFDSLTATLKSLSVPTYSTEGLPILVLDLDFTSYTHLLDQRERALQSGIYIPRDRDYTPADIRLNETTFPIDMRLAGPVDDLGEDDKWGLEIRVTDEGQLLEMHHWYLLDPQVNKGLNEWAFVQTLAQEGVLAARYQFIHLIFNGDDWGIYAMQEAADLTLLTAHQRQPGVIVQFDPQRLRQSIAHFQGNTEAAYADPVSNLSATAFQYFDVDTFQNASLDPDLNLAPQRDQALRMLRGLQTGSRKASETFDVEVYGRFLALVDLWDATQATSLINLHYYYNPISNLLEPISFNANPLNTDTRISLAATYNDPAIQRAYVQEAHRISQPAYLKQLQDTLEPKLAQLQKQMGNTHQANDLWAKLSERQQQIQRSLNPVQPVSAYLGPATTSISGTLHIEVRNLLNLPVEIVGFDIDGATFLDVDRRWVSEDSVDLLLDTVDARVVLPAVDTRPTPVIRYVRIEIPLTEIHRQDKETDFIHDADIQVATRILGLSSTQFTPAHPNNTANSNAGRAQ